MTRLRLPLSACLQSGGLDEKRVLLGQAVQGRVEGVLLFPLCVRILTFLLTSLSA